MLFKKIKINTVGEKKSIKEVSLNSLKSVSGGHLSCGVTYTRGDGWGAGCTVSYP